MPPLDPQINRDVSGHQMPVPPGQQNPMNPGQFPYLYNMQMMPPIMFPQEGATAQENPLEGGNFQTPQQLWMQQQMQMFLMYQREMQDQAAPPPYTASEGNSGLGNISGVNHMLYESLSSRVL